MGQTFRDALGRDPDGVFSAPGRVNLIGEHTDHNEGHVLPFAIDRRCRVAAAARDDDTVTVRSAQEPDDVVTTTLDALARARGWSAYALGTVWALREAGLAGAGWDLVVDGDVPLGAGLSSSAALESAVALAVAELSGCRRSTARPWPAPGAARRTTSSARPSGSWTRRRRCCAARGRRCCSTAARSRPSTSRSGWRNTSS